MDMQKSAASRVRHILQAMERSIDSARSRRVHDHGTIAQPNNGIAPASRPAPGNGTQDSWHNVSIPAQPRLAIGANQNHEPRAASPRDNGALIGGSPAARPALQPVDPNQPARIKAKPKRFEGTFASQFAPPAQPEYRSQAG